jgi:hypothetical protein
MAIQPVDLAPEIYTYLRQWWGLRKPQLTPKKCQLLARSIKDWRRAYTHGQHSKLVRMYNDDAALAGYLAAFGPRYAYTIRALLDSRTANGNPLKRHRICTAGDVLRACYIGGGSAIDLFGLLTYLYERKTPPRDMEIHFIDRSPQWRRFHNALFGSILPDYFPKTRALPYYHDTDLSNSALRYDASIQRVFDSRIFILSNVLSEFPEQRAIREHLRFLLRCARTTTYLVVADSSAPKLRPRLNWLRGFVESVGFPYYIQFEGKFVVSCDWLQKNGTTRQIFSPGGPSFLTSVNRWGFVAKIYAGHQGEDLSA